ncbi:hypothetical protein MRB53_020641 [Persea americana]|uniref:Uncharacterized protein n=1 Tax=Persea americana TaxID=3435 RepID=A0ACC2L1L3_PERAE|nr:hypothetical protein MRB53_020641 [Persea americana]
MVINIELFVGKTQRLSPKRELREKLGSNPPTSCKTEYRGGLQEERKPSNLSNLEGDRAGLHGRGGDRAGLHGRGDGRAGQHGWPICNLEVELADLEVVQADLEGGDRDGMHRRRPRQFSSKEC